MRSAFAQGSCAAPPNAIVAENCLTGNPPSEWEVTGSGDPAIQGFATEMSVNKGVAISFKVSTLAASYRIDIYRIGYYGGNGARKVATVLPSATLPQTQPSCLTSPSTGLIDCGNWAVSASWAVPATAVSGLYIAHLVRQDGTAGASHITFVVRDDAGAADILYQTSDTTWQAYNDYGGNSLYVGSPAGRAYKVSYNRPFVTRGNAFGLHTWWQVNEYPMIRWLERNGFNISYASGIDTDRMGSELLEHKIFLSSGHDEYWSAAQRANVEAARDAGIHLAFFSGNAIFWKTRWEASIDGSNTPYRTLVCYKETHANARIDPTPAWTGTWRDPRFSPPADGNRPENQLMGTIFKVNCCEGASINISSQEGKQRFWRNTTFATLTPGQTISTTSGVLGFEYDEAPNDAWAPPGLIRLSTTTRTVGGYLQDQGNTFAAGTATHSLTLHRRSSGALVFGAGTVRWSWGLDGGNHGDGVSIEDANMQQATINLFADMGVQPGTLQVGLVPATMTADTVPPVSSITSPTTGSSSEQQPQVITGSASDGLGVVAAVEVSVDGGATWRSATGTTAWTYTWTPLTTGTYALKSRAIDDSGNIEVPSGETSVAITPRHCPCTIWNATTTPAVASVNEAFPVELGLKFQAASAGYITGVRFYKGPANTGMHVGKLWSATGTLLASATFTGETSIGWQQVNFSSPVPTTANTTYIASYFAPNGGYAYSSFYFTEPVVNVPLRAMSSAESAGNGVFLYSAGGGFPNGTFNSTNYWVDVEFTTSVADTTPPIISAVTATPAANSATIQWTTNEPATSIVQYGTNPGTLDQTVSSSALVATHSVALSGLTSGVTYYYRVTSVDAALNSATATALPMPPLSFQMADVTPPIISGIVVTAGITQATIQWTTHEAATSRIEYGTNSANLNLSVQSTALVTAHSLNVPRLSGGRIYYFRLTSADALGNTATVPAAPAAPQSFTTIAVPTAVTITTGTLVSGNAASLNSNDDNYFSVLSDASNVTEWYATIANLPNTVSSLNFNYRGSSTRSCSQTVGIWNWVSSAWETLNTRTQGTSESNLPNLIPTGPAADYVSGLSGSGELRVRVRCQSTSKVHTINGEMIRLVFQ